MIDQSVPTLARTLPLLLLRAPRFTRRRLLLGAAALLLLGGAVIWVVARGLAGGAAPKGGAQSAASAPQARASARAKTAAKNAAGSVTDTGAHSIPQRVAEAPLAAALFSPHSWHVNPPPPPPAPPPAPEPPTAPPFPYTFVGAFTPSGDKTVFFLSHADRVIDVRVGDRLDGIYDFESADAGQLTFNYLPLNIRQTLSSGANL
jgi:hypothetical protein